MGMRRGTEKEGLSEGKRKALAIIAGVVLIIFVGFMFYTGQIKDKNEPTPEQTNNDPVQQQTEDPSVNEDNPDDIGVDEKDDTDFITGGEDEGRLNSKDLSTNLDDQSEIYSAVQAAESGMWELLNYSSETDSKEREESLKSMFTKDTPVNLKLPSKQERKDTYGGSFEYYVNFDAKNGQGGDTDDYRVELIGSKETVTNVNDNIVITENDTNGFNKIERADYIWMVSLKQVKGDKPEDNYWLVYNYKEAKI